MKTFRVLISSLFLLAVFYLAHGIIYADFTSTNFQLETPTITSGGESSSNHFQYFSATAQTTQGQSTSASFTQNAGFVYFPTATSPVVFATPGDAQVVLNWTAATGILANITSYDVGVSTSSGGTYTYTSVGNVTTSTKTGLTNSVPYFFKVRSFASGLLLSESAEVTATPVALVIPPGGGGGGGGGGTTTDTAGNAGVNFSGRAYPLSKVTILKDGQLVVSTIAGPDSNFSANLSGLSAGNYTFSVYGEDKNSLRSSPFTFQVSLTDGVTTKIGGIFIAPTISVDKSEVKQGDTITIFGQSSPSSQVVISVNSAQEHFETVPTDASGVYLQNFDTSVLEIGSHTTKSKSLKNGEISSFSDAVAFKVGTENIFADNTVKTTALKGDLNGDNKCNLIDFSIAAFWYKKAHPPANVDLNKDGQVDLVDFSIMAFYWTG